MASSPSRTGSPPDGDLRVSPGEKRTRVLEASSRSGSASAPEACSFWPRWSSAIRVEGAASWLRSGLFWLPPLLDWLLETSSSRGPGASGPSSPAEAKLRRGGGEPVSATPRKWARCAWSCFLSRPGPLGGSSGDEGGGEGPWNTQKNGGYRPAAPEGHVSGDNSRRDSCLRCPADVSLLHSQSRGGVPSASGDVACRHKPLLLL